jgi:hypothetical protein
MLVALLSIAIQSPVETGVWEKLIAPGVTYRMEVADGPLLINAVRVTPAAEGVTLTGELANGEVFDPESATKGRETVTAMAARKSSLVAINADFFPFTGDPLGAMVRKGELLSTPQNGRAVFCWGKDVARTGYLTFSGTVSFEGKTQSVFGVNQECGENMLVLNTPAAGYAVSREPATHVVCVLAETVAPTGQWRPKVRRTVENATSVPINDDEVVLTFRGSPKEKLTFLSTGDVFDLRLETKGADWNSITDVVAGGPYLVKAGKPFVPYAAEGFTDGFAKNKHPRSAIGRTPTGDFWLVAVDGRQSMSAGASLAEMAEIMVRLGCDEAINLDGGGSTALNVSSLTVNRPSEGTERPVANALLVFSSFVQSFALPVGEPGFVIAGPASVKVGGTAQYRVVDGSGADVEGVELLWSAQGGAWVDQSGLLRGSTEGTCRLLALSQGLVVSLTVSVTKG